MINNLQHPLTEEEEDALVDLALRLAYYDLANVLDEEAYQRICSMTCTIDGNFSKEEDGVVWKGMKLELHVLLASGPEKDSDELNIFMDVIIYDGQTHYESRITSLRAVGPSFAQTEQKLKVLLNQFIKNN